MASCFTVSFDGAAAAQCTHQLQTFLQQSTQTLPLQLHTQAALGSAVSWLLVNRPSELICTITSNAPSALHFYPPPELVPVPLANGDAMTCDPRIIEVVHMHCHFDKTAEARVAAIELLDSCTSALQSAGCPVLHTHVWDRKNGPHIGWSWELWIEQGLAVGVAVSPPLLTLQQASQ